MTDQNHPTTPLQLPSENSIVFSAPPTEEVLRLDKEGFHYRGQFIEDAGEAHRLMVEFLRQGTVHAKGAQPVGPTDEELCETYRTAYYAEKNRQGPHCMAAGLRAVLAHWGQP